MTDHLEVGASAPTPPANIDVVGELFDELQVVFKQLMEMDEQDVVDAQRLKMARQAPTDGNTTLIVPIGQVPSLALDTAIDTLLATFNHSVQIEPRIPIPGEAFNQRRKQYRAVHILERLEHCILPDTFRVIGLIDEDIYGPGTNQVLGLHLPGSRAIVLGVHRLMFPSPQEYKPAEAHQRIASLLVSQVSGSLGLPVCKNRACARSVPTTLVDSEQRSAQLCPDCAAQLKGWLR
jgi:predicted Zn-dependent protease